MGAVAFGMEATAAGGHLLGLSDIAPGNKVYALAVIIMGSPIQDRPKLVDALMAAAHEEGPESVSCLKDAVAIVSEQLASLDDPLEALRLYGGREIAASVGAIVAARSRRLPVVVDGWAAIAAMAVLNNECPGSIDHVYIASTDSGLMGRILPSIGKSALLGVKVDTGAGCGNAISVSILKAACDL